ncbi:hypothetical protein BGZ54_003927 [Gamsiella multidivaricata]|nr:hypothetical protein BGZ54_003927 [Gamsiella multidivaricata]
MYSTTTDTTAATGSRYSGEKKYSDAPIRPSARRQRSRATDILLNLESSSNDARFQEILHNSIALDHFRQFCFQEYSIENLLFWMDVELFAKPSKEFLKMGRRSKPMDQSDEKDEDEKEQDDLGADKTQEMSAEQFGVQHARYIYLTYIDSCGPLQVNLSDESRTDIPWPILDYESPNVLSMPSSVAPSPRPIEKKKGGYRWGSLSKDSRKEERRQGEDDVVGWPLDRHMFDGAQEHTYQLMKGHTLVRFEESDLWKATEKIKREQPDEYAKATFQGPFNSHYRPNKSVILSTVARSRSRHPSARPLTLYNWNNSTSDLDRSRDKEEALAETMSQYFGPIPTSIRHPSRVILGLGRADDFGDDEFEDSDDFENCAPNGRNLSNIRASANSVAARAAGGTRRHLFSKRLNDNIVGRKGNSNLSEDMMDLYADDHYRSSQDTVEIESIENGKRTTRWMVAGYFSDHVRLTAAQRKRLLRRNNKLTKFFGSRVDGTLCPVEEITENGVSRVALAGPSSAPTMGSPLAYALSSSTIHDMDKKHMSKLRGNGKSIKIKRNMMGSGSEVLLLSPGEGVTNKPKSSNLLQKFRRSSPELEDERGYMAFQSLASSRHPFDARRSPTSSRGSIFKKTGEKDGPGHFRSKTATDLQHHERRILAHPHPLWSGSLSDQEGVSSSAYERRRGMSILSIMGNSNLGGYSGGGVAPTTPTSAMIGLHAWHKVGADQAGGASLDRQAMYSRRKKADKLSTFFGAQLTTLELSSQLPMGQEDSMVGFSQQQHRKAKIDRMSSDSNQQQSKRIGGVTVSSVNQLSDRERTALWKRNKKLRGLLGESLPETQVAAALTRPVLFSSRFKGIGAQGRRTSAGNRVVRRRRQSSVTSKAGSRHGAEDEDTASDDGQSEDDEEEEEGDEDMDALLDASSGASRTSKGKGKIPKRSGVRSRRLSTVSASPRKGYQSRPSRVHRSSLTRLTSHQSLRSFLSIDSLVTAGALQDDDDYDQDFATGIPPSPGIKKGSIRPFSQTDLSANAHVVGCVAGNNRSPKKVGMSRYHRKKKMDKIHQFLGDRVPEQDLWMGTVGRERTQEMLDLNLLSPTSSVGSGSPSLSSLERHGFHAGRSSCGSTGKGKTADLRAAVTGSAAAFGSAPARVTTGGKDESAKMERLLSDPRGLGMGRGKSEGLAEDLKQLQGQSVKQCFTTTGRLRQQLASPIPPPLSTSKGESMSGIGQLLHADANVNANNNNSADAGCISSSSATSGPALPLSPLTTTTTAENDLTSFTLVQDSRYDNDSGDDIAAAQILPRLRAMSGKDQERFLRRAEKLERYFGQFPPSVFLENSLKSKSSCTGDSRVASAGSEGRKKEEKGQRLKKDQLSKRSLSEEVEDMVESLGVTDTKF